MPEGGQLEVCEPVDDRARRQYRDPDNNRDDGGDHEQDQPGGRYSALVEPAHALRLDDLVAYPHPGQDRACHSRPTFVEELYQVEPHANGDDQPGSELVGQQNCHVLACARCRAEYRIKFERSDTLESGRTAIRVGVYDEFGTAGQGAVRDRVHVADDEVRLVARVEQRISTAVHRNQHRFELSDVGPQRLQIFPVTVAARDHKGMPALKLRPERRHPDAIDELLEIAADVFDRIRHEGPDLRGQVGLGIDRCARHRVGGLHCPLGNDGLADVERVPVKANGPPIAHLLEDLGADVVDQRDARLKEKLRSKIRIPARHTGRCVDDCNDLALQQGFRADPVQVRVVDDGDVAGPQAPGQVLGAAIEPRSRYQAG